MKTGVFTAEQKWTEAVTNDRTRSYDEISLDDLNKVLYEEYDVEIR